MTAANVVERDSEAKVREHMAFVDAAMAVAGHEVKDPCVRNLTERVLKHEITAEQELELAKPHILG